MFSRDDKLLNVEFMINAEVIYKIKWKKIFFELQTVAKKVYYFYSCLNKLIYPSNVSRVTKKIAINVVL